MSKSNQKGSHKHASKQDKANQPLPAVSATPNKDPEQSSPTRSDLTAEEMLSVLDEMFGFNEKNEAASETTTEDIPTKENKQSSPNTSGMTAGEISWKKFQEMPYDNSRIGQAFIMSAGKPHKGKKGTQGGEK